MERRDALVSQEDYVPVKIRPIERLVEFIEFRGTYLQFELPKKPAESRTR